MTQIKLVLALGMPEPKTEEQKKQECGPSIEERMEYAVDCITCGHNVKESVLFLQKLLNHLQNIPNRKKGDDKRLAYLRAALSDYGYLMPDDV
jgi:hypothetical protein